MAIIGFLFVVVLALIFTFYAAIGLVFGGTDLQPLGGYHWVWILMLVIAMWYAIFRIAPFTITVSG